MRWSLVAGLYANLLSCLRRTPGMYFLGEGVSCHDSVAYPTNLSQELLNHISDRVTGNPRSILTCICTFAAFGHFAFYINDRYHHTSKEAYARPAICPPFYNIEPTSSPGLWASSTR